MKLEIKGLIWFLIVGLYVMTLGGMVYHNMFRKMFDERLKQEILEFVRMKTAEMNKGLLDNPNAITLPEYDVMEAFRSDRRVTDILYINGGGKIRWYKNAKYFGLDVETFAEQTGYNISSLLYAYRDSTHKVLETGEGNYYDMAFPFQVKGGDIIGILGLRVSRSGVKLIIGDAMRRYVMAAVGVLFFMGLPLWAFLKNSVVKPLNNLRGSIDNVSSKVLEIRYTGRRDEMGLLAQSLVGFLEKVRTEIIQYQQKEIARQRNEQSWWRVILDTAVPPSAKAIVADEDNNVLFANFELNRFDESQKLHILDVLDAKDQRILQYVSSAIEAPGEVVEGEADFKGEPCKCKTVRVNSEGDVKRTLIVFEKLEA